MKKNFSLMNNNIPQKKLLGFWAFYHIAVLVFFLTALIVFRGQISIDSDLFNLVPKSISMASVKKADDKMMAVTSQNVFVLVANQDFGDAKKAAEEVYARLDGSSNFESLSLYSDIGSMSEITDFLYENRWNLLDEKTADEILQSEEAASDFAMNALAQAYSGFTMLPLDNLESDPFLLTEYNLKNYLDAVQNAGTAMSVKDGVLSSKFEDKWYVMIRGTLSPRGARLASKNNAITEIYKACDDVKKEMASETSFVFSGTPFHSHESSNSASREISIIATVSMLVVILLLIFIFRSAKPLFLSVGVIALSVGTAFLATLAVFHKMHVITLVFGTSLIGSCIDYSLHFFTHWAGNKKLNSGEAIRNHIFSGLLMAIISTGICFAILLFAPFAILKQMSLFCLIGLVSSFLTTIAIYPFIKLPRERGKVRFTAAFAKAVSLLEQKWVGRSVISALFIISIILILVFHKNIKVKNNLLTLYDMQGRLLEDEITASKVIQYTPGGWYIVSGSSEEEVLENEEKLRASFEKITEGSVGYVSTSNFIPSELVQKKSRNAYERLLDFAQAQFEALGYDSYQASLLAENMKKDYKDSEGKYLSFEAGKIPEFISSAISSAWLGEIDGKYYSVMLPTRVTDYTTYRSLVEDNEDAFFISKSQDISADLDKLTIMVLKFFVIAYLLMFLMLKFFYSGSRLLKSFRFHF